ncbi:MAG: hypothetical protein EP344_01175 [Bacteroidetes bacterium]|nr:MAG: hypothetical protein EP344_01175 [Bacteroidota bacterium]
MKFSLTYPMFTRTFFLFLLLFSAAGLTSQTSVGNWQADLAFLQRELPKRHPNLYFSYPQASFEADLDRLSQSLEGKADLQIGLELQLILARLGDAQTRLELAPLLQKDKVIPLGLGWYEGGLYVSGTVKKFEPALGKQVLGMNRIRIEPVLERMGQFFARENPEAIRRDGPLWLRFPAAFRLAGISPSDTLELVLQDDAGKQYLMKVFPLDFKREKSGMQPAQFMQEHPDLRWDPVKKIYSMNWLESDSIAYIQYNACYSREMIMATGDTLSAMQLPAFQPFADSVVALLHRHPGARFFFDLRFNSGGMPADGIALAERLAAMPELNRPDRIYIAVNRYTGGAAVEIASAFQAKTRATLIGEVPPVRPNHFGDPQSFKLPNSDIEVFYGTRTVHVLPGNPDTLQLTLPMELPFSAFREGRDPLLDYVREHPLEAKGGR